MLAHELAKQKNCGALAQQFPFKWISIGAQFRWRSKIKEHSHIDTQLRQQLNYALNPERTREMNDLWKNSRNIHNLFRWNGGKWERLEQKLNKWFKLEYGIRCLNIKILLFFSMQGRSVWLQKEFMRKTNVYEKKTNSLCEKETNRLKLWQQM